MPIDYEKEYDNRARVPEYTEIFTRWERDAAAYQAWAYDAKLGLSYGPSPRQIVDLFPAKDDGASTPLAMFIHGGWWRTLGPSMFSQMAKGPNAKGVTVAVVGYDLVPQVTVSAIIEQMRNASLWLWREKRRRIMVYGNSAGAHLAACLVATDWKTLAADVPADLVPAAYAISGVYDLAPVLKISPNQDIRLDETSARSCSPIYWRVPAGRMFDAVVGGLESAEFLRQSRTITEAWKAAAKTRYEEVAGKNHFTTVDALTDANSAMTERVAELARQVSTISL
jgi:arylformamidase